MTRKIGIFTAIAVLILSTLACSFPLGIAATSPTETQTPKPAVAPPTVAPTTGAPSPTLKPQNEVSTLTPFPPAAMFTPTPVTGGGGGGGGVGTATLTVVNNSSQTIFYLYISPSTSSSWGNDQLGASTIPVGGNHVFPGITPGTYDLKAENSSHTVIQTWMGVTLNGSMTWTVTGGGGGGGVGTATLTVVNNSSQTIFYLYISPSTSSSWGNDQLGASTIPAGGTYTFTGITPGTYDLKAENSSHTVIQTWMGVSLTGSTTWTVTSSGGGGGGGTATLTVVNNSGTTIFYLYISPSTSSSWGNDQLGASTIPAGGTYTFTGITPGTYDLKAEDSSHNVIRTWMGVSLTGSTTWTVTSSGGGGGGGTATLTVVNNSGQTIFYLYISPSTSSSWGNDQLGSSVIPAGGTYTFTGITPGTYDLKAENSSHTVIRTWMGVSLSGSVTWTVSP